MQKIIFALVACIFALSPLSAQLSTSNLFVFDLQRDTPTDSITLSTPRYISDYNRNGYNNHPAFLNETELLVSASMPGQEQPDLYALNLLTKERIRMTDTEPGEYSPRLMPDQYNFSAIRMEYLPKDTIIRLWQFPFDRSSNGRPIFADKYNIGYYTWLNSRDIVLFKVQTPNQLVLTDLYSGQETVIASNVGRCFMPGDRGTLLYQQIQPDGGLDIMAYDARAYTIEQKYRKIVAGLPGSQDFAVLQDGSLLAASNSELYQYQPGKDETWQKIADLSTYDIKGISRIVISPNGTRIAIVAQ